MDEELPELWAWVGEDELGSGEIGVKRAMVGGMYKALVTTRPRGGNISEYLPDLEAAAACYGKKIRLVHYVPMEVVLETSNGTWKQVKP